MRGVPTRSVVWRARSNRFGPTQGREQRTSRVAAVGPFYSAYKCGSVHEAHCLSYAIASHPVATNLPSLRRNRRRPKAASSVLQPLAGQTFAFHCAFVWVHSDVIHVRIVLAFASFIPSAFDDRRAYYSTSGVETVMGQGKSTPQPTPTPPVQTRNVRQAWGKYLTSEEEISKKTPQDMAKDERFRITELPEDAQAHVARVTR